MYVPFPFHYPIIASLNNFKTACLNIFTFFNYVQATFPASGASCMPIVTVHMSWGVAGGGGGSSALPFSKIVSPTRVTAISVCYTSFY